MRKSQENNSLSLSLSLNFNNNGSFRVKFLMRSWVNLLNLQPVFNLCGKMTFDFYAVQSDTYGSVGWIEPCKSLNPGRDQSPGGTVLDNFVQFWTKLKRDVPPSGEHPFGDSLAIMNLHSCNLL